MTRFTTGPTSRSAPSRRPALAFLALAMLSLAAASYGSHWGATLTGREGRKVTGSATVQPAADTMSITAMVMIDGDTPGATRPWHIHTGTCAAGGGVAGPARSYAPITIDAKGHGMTTATVAVQLADTGHYYVNIHESSAAMSTIVACGDLVKK